LNSVISAVKGGDRPLMFGSTAAPEIVMTRPSFRFWAARPSAGVSA
jgi:hypothetical protein